MKKAMTGPICSGYYNGSLDIYPLMAICIKKLHIKDLADG